MKHIAFAILFILTVTAISFGQFQPAAEISGNYQFTRVMLPSGLGSYNMPEGFNTGVNVPISKWFGAVGNVGYFSKSASYSGATGTVSVTTYGGGPQFTYRNSGPIQPFANFVLGGAHLSASASVPGFGSGSSGTTAFFFAPGGGIEARLSKVVWLRGGANYFRTSKYGYAVDGVQVFAGVSFHVGGHNSR